MGRSGRPRALSAHLTPQAAIDLRRPKPSECDIVVVILWARMGTPLPEEYRKRDGTRYLSGTEWEFLDAMAAAQRHGRPTVLVYRRTEAPNMSLADPERDEKIRQYEAVKTFFEGFRNADGSPRWSYEPYASPSEFREKLERQLRELVTARLEKALAQQAPPISSNRPPASVGEETEALWQGNPYRGLDAFRPEDAPIFFGRAPETDALIARVGSARVVAVIGPSGSGKSSLVAAGLLPRLAAGALPGSAEWLVVRFTPAEAGEDPFRALALRLCPHGGTSQASVDGLAEHLRSAPDAIEAWAKEGLSGRPASSQLLLFADQFEELFTPRVAEVYRDPFVALVGAIAEASRVRLVLTLRADYYEHCTRYESLAKTLREGSFPLAMPAARALSEMIERPARAAGLLLEPGLVDAILKDAGTEPGALALVEFTSSASMTPVPTAASRSQPISPSKASRAPSRSRAGAPCRTRTGEWTSRPSRTSSGRSPMSMRRAARCASGHGSNTSLARSASSSSA